MELRRWDVILACVALFIAWGYVTHWAPSLRYAPQAFIAGIAVTIAGTTYVILSTTRAPHHGDIRPIRAPQHVYFVSAQAWQKETASLKQRSIYRREPLYPSSFLVSDYLDELLDLILRDFVQSWYGNISPRPTFTNEVDRAIRAALCNIRDKLLAVDLVEMTISRLVPMITAHMRDFYEAERVVRGRKLSRDITESEELDMAIAAKYRDGKLHPAASLTYSNPKTVQQQHLRGIVTRLMSQVLPRNMRTSLAVNTLIKEIVACAVLCPIMELLSDPDTWNQMLEGYGRTLLQDRKTVRKLRAALDEHAPQSPKNSNPTSFPRLAPGDNERKFERFIRAIRQCSSLSDARRARSEIASQYKKEVQVEGQDQLYLRRLETARRILDQKVVHLSAGSIAAQKPSLQVPGSLPRENSRLENATLRHVLYDASGLSYFMEFMDRQGLMRLVQFWIVVDGFRNPLEEDIGETDEPGLDHSFGASDRADLAQMYEAYLVKPELAVPDHLRRTVDSFLKAGKKATSAQYLAARRAVLQTQTYVYLAMQDKHFPRFKKSDLWYKWLASDEASAMSKNLSPTKGPIHTNSYSGPPAPGATPPSLSRTLSSQSVDLRRAAVSTSDLKSVKNLPTAGPVRRSLDDTGRPPLFDDDLENDPLAGSTQSVDSELDAGRGHDDNSQVVDAMQEALNDIMDNEPDRDSLFSDGPKSAQENESMRGSLEITRASSPAFLKKDSKEKPNIASLGLVGAPKTRGVFEDDLFGDEEEKFPEDEIEDSDPNDNEEDEIHEAAPGDLGLAEAIDALTLEIDRLSNQESIVDSLRKKAELTNNAAELRILRKSKASLQREIHRKELQRQQYVIQESDNSLYGRATVSIQSIMVGKDEEGGEFALYVIEVHRAPGEHMPAATWVIPRRYSEFHELNKRLRSKYPMIRNLEFPRRQVMLKLQRDFLQKRRASLEKWLRELLLIPAICRSRELRAFLSQRTISNGGDAGADQRGDMVARIYSSVTDGMEEFLGNIPVLDQLSLAGQNLISAATTQLQNAAAGGPNSASANGSGTATASLSSPTQGPPPSAALAAAATNTSPLVNDPQTAAEAEAELRAYENSRNGVGGDLSSGPPSFIKPICDLFLEAFELNRENNWLRGRAVVMVLHQLLGGTIERKVRDNVRAMVADESIVKWVGVVRGALFPESISPAGDSNADDHRPGIPIPLGDDGGVAGGPGGVIIGGVAEGVVKERRRDKQPRTKAQREQSRKEAGLLLATLIPDLAGSVVGRANAQAASRRVLATLNNQRLNTHLVFSLLDEIIQTVFGA
ncbi:PXA domain-containing protein [Phyllosticta citriasiana]|uniref:PXA domain-containing protein n=1 Tax=Phyllosticta citriasiana TaxID=595635 RepID=A0ABR1KHK2_9PEZI